MRHMTLHTRENPYECSVLEDLPSENIYSAGTDHLNKTRDITTDDVNTEGISKEADDNRTKKEKYN